MKQKEEIEKQWDKQILEEAQASALILGWFEGWCQKTKRGGGVLITTSIKELLTDFYNDLFKAGYAAATPSAPEKIGYDNDFRQAFGEKFGFIDNRLSEREMFIEEYFLKKQNK